MRNLIIIAGLLIGTPVTAQVSNPPIVSVDTSQFATKAEIQAAQQAAADAKAKADAAASTATTADSKASAAQTAATGAIKTVNGITPTNGNVALTIPAAPDLSPYATTANVTNLINAATSGTVKAVNGATPNASGVVTLAIPSAADLSPYATTTAVNNMISTATAGVVKTVNSATPNASGAVTLAIPTAATTVPPSVADSGATGTMTTMYALANHTHASKARKVRATSAADGSYTWTFTTPFTTGVVPLCVATAETVAGVTDVINVQIEGTPTATSVNLRVNRANRSVASLLGLTVLSIPSQPGATAFHAICLEP